MRTILIALLGFGAATAVAQQKEMFVSIPCRCAVEDVQFVREPGHAGTAGGPIVVSIAVLKKTDTRKTLSDLTPKERRKLQRQARWAHACEIWVIDEYKTLPARLEAQAEKQRATFEKEMHFYMIQRSRPCPECPSASN